MGAPRQAVRRGGGCSRVARAAEDRDTLSCSPPDVEDSEKTTPTRRNMARPLAARDSSQGDILGDGSRADELAPSTGRQGCVAPAVTAEPDPQVR